MNKDIKSFLLKDVKDYYLACFADDEGILDEIAAALDKGIKLIIYKNVSQNIANFIALGQKIRQLCSIYCALFIIYNSLDMVNILDADGVHLDKNSYPIKYARDFLNKDKIIGLSDYSDDSADYYISDKINSDIKKPIFIKKDDNKILYHTNYLNFKYAVSPSGHNWCYVSRTNDTSEFDSAVTITTLVKKENGYNYLFLKTKRPPIYGENKAKYCLESPAGLIADEEKGESLMECAKKELLEEAGLVADELYIELINSSTSAGLTSETLSYITAIINNPKEIKPPVSDGGVIVERLYVPAHDIFNYINSLDKKEISISAAFICGIYYAQERLKLILG